MNFLEKDLEQIVYETNSKTLENRGLEDVQGKRFRQFRVGNYGIADMITFEKPEALIDKHGVYQFHDKAYITVYEFKKDKIGVSAFMQALGYAKGISSYLNKRYNYRFNFSLRIVLIGRNIDLNSNFVFLPEMLLSVGSDKAFLECFTCSYGIDGVEFTSHFEYTKPNEGFKNKEGGKL
jgi:hypothetical protein